MKEIASATGRLLRQMDQNSTGQQLGGAGYAVGRQKSSALDHGPTEPALPAVRVPRNTLPKALSTMPLPSLPELRSVILGQTQDGSKITAMVLARSADLPSLKSSISQMTEALAPASQEEIASSLARLFSHYPQQQSGSPMSVAQDWVEDMSGVSATAFRAAVLKWRRDPNAFKPSPGQLLAIIEKIEQPLRSHLEYAMEILEREETMPVRERLAHLHQREYEISLGMVPYDVHVAGYDEISRYLEEESALVAAEIAQLQGQGA